MIYIPQPQRPSQFPFNEATSKSHWGIDSTDVVLPSNKSWVTDFVYRMRGKEAPTLFNVWTALSTLSAVFRRNTWYAIESEPLYTNMYVLLVGQAGIVKKTASTEEAMRILHYYNTLWQDSPYFPVKKVEVLSDDFTTEAMIERMHRGSKPRVIKDADDNPLLDKHGNPLRYYPDSSCIIFGDEISSTFRAKYQLGNLEFLKAIYSNKSVHEHLTKSSGLQTLRNLHTNFLGSTTINGFEAIPTNMFTDGFLSRMIIAYEFDSDRDYPHMFVPEGAPTYDDLAQGLKYLSVANQGAFEPTREATEWYENWYFEFKHKLRKNPDDAGVLSRLQLFVRKIATLLAAAEYDNNENKITLTHLTDADRLLRYTYSQNPLLGTTIDDHTAERGELPYVTVYERVGQLLRRSTDKHMTCYDIQRRCKIRGKYPSVAMVKRIVLHLLQNDKIEVIAKNGREVSYSDTLELGSSHKVKWLKTPEANAS